MSGSAAGSGRLGVVRACARTCLPLGLAACVTTYEEAPLFTDRLERPEYAVPVTIPIEGATASADQALVAEFYRGVLQRLHEATKERDLPQLEGLLANYERSDLPPALRDRVRGYRAIARGLRFCQHAVQRAELVVLPPAAAGAAAPPIEAGQPALGAPLHLELRLPAGPEELVLGGQDDGEPIGFLVSLRVEDAFVEGSSHSGSSQRIVRLPASIRLHAGAVLQLPIDVELAGGTAIRREVHARVDLMPGYLQAADGRLPVPQTTVAAIALVQWPKGYGEVAAAPLAELRAALRTFEPKLFPRAYLAAAACQGVDRETAIDLLLEQVRFGRTDQAQVAMAALRALTGLQFLVGDRDAWLAWSQDRR